MFPCGEGSHSVAATGTRETVSAVREADGAWRIVGYFVH